MQKDHLEIDSNLQILSFFSSYLKDILQLASDIKYQTYKLVGVDSYPQKKIIVNNNIYSIMEACNQSFEDLRRTQSLLRGHLKGKNQNGKERYFQKSRHTIQNEIFNNINKSTNNFKKSFKKLQFQTQNHMNQEQGRNNFVSFEKQEIHGRESEENSLETPLTHAKILKESKSHGHLINKGIISPPSEASRTKLSQKKIQNGSVQLIQKIRRQLGLLNQ